MPKLKDAEEQWREYQRDYMRQWRRKNAERIRKYHRERYWRRKAEETKKPIGKSDPPALP